MYRKALEDAIETAPPQWKPDHRPYPQATHQDHDQEQEVQTVFPGDYCFDDIDVNTNAAIKIQTILNLTDMQIKTFLGSLNLLIMLDALRSHFASDQLE